MALKDSGMAPYDNRARAISGEQWRAVTHIVTPPFNTPDAERFKELLKQHGCRSRSVRISIS
jgi:hypothetical protein